jgi:hypothetical protein
MNLKITAGVLLIAFSLVSLGVLIGKEMSPAPDSASKKPDIPTNGLIVYYFHATKRCDACNTIERLTKDVLSTKFSAEMQNGSLVFKSINYQEPGNEKYPLNYKFSANSIILSKIKNVQEEIFYNLSAIWQLYTDEPKFREYIEENVKATLEE